MIDTLPDVVPVVDRVEKLPGLTIATGMSGHGFGIGPGMGRVVADLVAGNDPGHDLTRFRLSRFTDGSAIVPPGPCDLDERAPKGAAHAFCLASRACRAPARSLGALPPNPRDI
jgi:hypothetical protein